MKVSMIPPILGRDAVLSFMEKLIKDGAGFRTPQGFLYALEWFGVAFGYQNSGFKWPRCKHCKRMADDYASKAPSSNPAPYFEVAVLAYLEKVLLDINRPLHVRVTAGKLRLCAQAAIRHSDLTRTSFTRLEWCRLQGTSGVLGLRAKVDRTKTGPRPWVASHLGVVARHDNWLPTLVDLLALSHGDQWHSHDFIGREVISDGSFGVKPATIEADAIIIGLRISDFPKDFAPPPETDPSTGRRRDGSAAAPAMDKRDFEAEPATNFGPMLPDVRELCEELSDGAAMGTNAEVANALKEEASAIDEPEVEEGENPFAGLTSDSASDSDQDNPDDELESYCSYFLATDRKGSRVHKPLSTEGVVGPMSCAESVVRTSRS